MTLTDLQRDTAYKYLNQAVVRLTDLQMDADDLLWEELDIEIGQLNEMLEVLAEAVTG